MSTVDTLATRLAHIQQRIVNVCQRVGRDPHSVALLPVSKTFEAETIRAAAALGLTRFGENKTQEIRQKAELLSDLNVQWILIGHLQTNKAKEAVRDVAEVQSLDRLALAHALHQRLQPLGRHLTVLVQVKTSSEPSKAGIAPEEVAPFLRRLVSDYPTLRVQGLMTLAENSSDPHIVRACFRSLRLLRDQLRALSLPGISLERLSMGMSGDFELAIEEGSTEVRIGSALFGARHATPQG